MLSEVFYTVSFKYCSSILPPGLIAFCWGRFCVTTGGPAEDLFNPIYEGCFDRILKLHRFCSPPPVCLVLVSLLFSNSLTQPVVVLPNEGESDEELSARTPVVYLIGSRNNVGMYANTLTSTTIMKDENGTSITLGRTYSTMFNAK